MKKIIYDCDPGIDDALAIILALKSGIISIEAITTVFGNSPVEITTNNALRLLEYLNKEIPVGIGAEKPLSLDLHNLERAKSVHGKDGLGDTPLLLKKANRKSDYKAVELILKKIKQGVRTIVATGALTNIADAFKKDPKTMNLLKELIIMGGVILRPGNIDRLSEANFYSDPHAADFIINQNIKKILIPLNVTHQTILTKNHLNQIPNSKTGMLVKSIVKNYQDFYIKNSNLPGCPLHDPLAMGYAINPGFLKLTPMNLKVETQGKYTRGVCVPELRKKMISQTKPNILVAKDVNIKAFLDFFIKTISK